MRYTYGAGTFLDTEGKGFTKGRALCTDGVVRSVRFPTGGTADMFSTVPAVVTAYGKAVSGFVVVKTLTDSEVSTPDDPAVVCFFPYAYRKNANVIPPWPESGFRHEVYPRSASADYCVDVYSGSSIVERQTFPSRNAAYGYVAEREGVITHSWQYEGEGERIHYAVMWDRKLWHRWCEPGHPNYQRARDLLKKS